MTEARMTDARGSIKCITRKLPRELRDKLWQKHLGMPVDGQTAGGAEARCTARIDLDKPLDSRTIEGIKKLAARNLETYSAVFVQTARDGYVTLIEGRNKGT